MCVGDGSQGLLGGDCGEEICCGDHQILAYSHRCIMSCYTLGMPARSSMPRAQLQVLYVSNNKAGQF